MTGVGRAAGRIPDPGPGSPNPDSEPGTLTPNPGCPCHRRLTSLLVPPAAGMYAFIT